MQRKYRDITWARAELQAIFVGRNEDEKEIRADKGNRKGIYGRI